MASSSDSFDVDEWDGQSSFAQHAVAGSIAGLAEHSLVFPLDTLKTFMQARQTQVWAPTCTPSNMDAMASNRTMYSSFAQLSSAGGIPRMWRGVQTVFYGCIPAHAAYFSIYESCKARLSRMGVAADVGSGAADAGGAGAGEEGPGSHSAIASGVAVAVATMAHDVIMTPMDCIKQRLQLGHHRNSAYDCACAIMRTEGPRAFMLSYPTTLLMNVPYATIMGSSNEALRGVLNPRGEHSLTTYILAGAGSGMLAAAATNPLDVVKTRLQTQHLRAASPKVAEAATAMHGPPCPRSPLAAGMPQAYTGMLHAMRTVWKEEGYRGFSRGMQARMLMHAPSVAICWTTYEAVKHTLGKTRLFD